MSAWLRRMTVVVARDKFILMVSTAPVIDSEKKNSSTTKCHEEIQMMTRKGLSPGSSDRQKEIINSVLETMTIFTAVRDGRRTTSGNLWWKRLQWNDRTICLGVVPVVVEDRYGTLLEKWWQVDNKVKDRIAERIWNHHLFPPAEIVPTESNTVLFVGSRSGVWAKQG